MISVCFQGNPFNITVIQGDTPTSNAEEAEVERFYGDLQDLLELTPKKEVLFIIGDWNAKVGNQMIPGVTGKFGLGVQNEAGQRLTKSLSREHTDHSKQPFATTEETTRHMDTKVLVPQSSTTLCNPLDSSPPGSSVHGILQARILE